MSWLGRHFMGTPIHLALQCRDGDGLAAWPTVAPTATVYDSSWEPVVIVAGLPPRDKASATGLFSAPLLLDTNFSAGRHAVLYEWNDGTDDRAELDYFEAIGGWANAGHGAYTGLYWYERPTGQFLVGVDELGGVSFRKNPRLK